VPGRGKKGGKKDLGKKNVFEKGEGGEERIKETAPHQSHFMQTSRGKEKERLKNALAHRW